jgi:hypothetical protein
MESFDMTREDIIRMAREANVYCTTRQPTLDAMLERFATLVAAAEREACAKLADEYATWGGSNFFAWFKKLSADIRARGQA